MGSTMTDDGAEFLRRLSVADAKVLLDRTKYVRFCCVDGLEWRGLSDDGSNRV